MLHQVYCVCISHRWEKVYCWNTEIKPCSLGSKLKRQGHALQLSVEPSLEVLLATCHRHRHESLHVTFGCERLLLSVHCNQVSPLQLVPPKQVYGSITCWPSKGTKYLCSTFASVFITICGQLILFWFPSRHVESLQLLIPVSCLLCKLLASVIILHICFLFIKSWTHLSFCCLCGAKRKSQQFATVMETPIKPGGSCLRAMMAQQNGCNPLYPASVNCKCKCSPCVGLPFSCRLC